LIIGHGNYPIEELAAEAPEGQELTVRKAWDLDEGQEIFFENSTVLIIAETELPGISDFIRELKSDEAVNHIPALGIIRERSKEAIREVLDTGFDAYLEQRAVPDLLAAHIRPLLRANMMNGIRMKKISDLQEKAVRDFILLDLIKDYVPQTLWDIAKDFAHQQKIEIPEEKLELTVVFGDLKEFTPRTQRMNPEHVIAYLNTAFEIVSRYVYQYAGDIDKFIGDAFLAVFPTAESAVKSMIMVQREIKSLNVRRSQKEMESIYFRIGIHTGPVIRGNVGGNHRYDNTLIGDTVNIASRLEQLAPAGGIVLSEMTRRRMGISIASKYQRSVKLKGRTGQSKVYDISSFIKPLKAG